MLSLSDFDYQLPDALIAQSPIEPRDHSRLLAVMRPHGGMHHLHFYDLPDLLDENCLIVRNNTKVMPARILGHKTTGGAMEILLTKKVAHTTATESWECLTRPGIKLGQKILFDGSTLAAECTQLNDYTRTLVFNQTGFKFLQSLDKIGKTPLPPYIEWQEDDEQKIRERYQTLYAQFTGSVAAPTAGLHFTPAVDTALRAKGIEILEVTLHVGLGTFLPVKDEDITHHTMHSEWYELTEEVAAKLNAAKIAGKVIVAVGTTTCRVLETCADRVGHVIAGTGETEIYIYPPYQFKMVDALLTNFHLPKSTLLMLISALVSAPNTLEEFTDFQHSLVGKVYAEAIKNQYRFFSFGDAMLIR